MSAAGGDDVLFEQAVGGDGAAFAALVEPMRRGLFRHCYRMLGSGVAAEDASQDTLERAWRGIGTLKASAALRGWLYRIATNVCLDQIRRSQSRSQPTTGSAETPDDYDFGEVEPVTDFDLVAQDEPSDQVERREDISLAFVAALQRLPARQRAALLLVDVLGFSHQEVSEVLQLHSGSVNSLLSRARSAARNRPARAYIDPDDSRARDLLERYVQAWHLADITTLVRLISDDVRFSMPPMPLRFTAKASVVAFIEQSIFSPLRPGGVPMQQGRCNGQPAFATYQPDGSGHLVVSGLQILELTETDNQLLVQSIVSYRLPALAIRCGFPPSLD